MKFDYWHVFFSMVLLIIVGILEVILAENVVDMEYNKNPLYDYVHKNVPEINPQIPSTIGMWLLLYPVLRFYNKPQILTFYFLSSSVLLIGRSFTFTLTQTPPVTTMDDPYRTKRCKKTMFKHFGISFTDLPQSCIDNMYSAHTIHSIVPMMIVLLYSRYQYEKIFICIIALLNAFFIIISRMHYTSDVIISVFLSITCPLALKYVFNI
jgi:hypothetical protein